MCILQSSLRAAILIKGVYQNTELSCNDLRQRVLDCLWSGPRMMDGTVVELASMVTENDVDRYLMHMRSVGCLATI